MPFFFHWHADDAREICEGSYESIQLVRDGTATFYTFIIDWTKKIKLSLEFSTDFFFIFFVVWHKRSDLWMNMKNCKFRKILQFYKCTRSLHFILNWFSLRHSSLAMQSTFLIFSVKVFFSEDLFILTYKGTQVSRHYDDYAIFFCFSYVKFKLSFVILSVVFLVFSQEENSFNWLKKIIIKYNF